MTLDDLDLDAAVAPTKPSKGVVGDPTHDSDDDSSFDEEDVEASLSEALSILDDVWALLGSIQHGRYISYWIAEESRKLKEEVGDFLTWFQDDATEATDPDAPSPPKDSGFTANVIEGEVLVVE